jgi:hypothetical protein
LVPAFVELARKNKEFNLVVPIAIIYQRLFSSSISALEVRLLLLQDVLCRDSDMCEIKTILISLIL